MVSVDCVRCLSSECRVRDVWCKCHVAVFSLFFLQVLHCVFCFDINVLITGDLRHEYAQSTWGFPFRRPPGYWLHSQCLRCGNWRSFDDDYRCGMSIIMILMTSSWRLYRVHWRGRLVAPSLIATALLIALEECSSREHFVALQWWRWLRPPRSVMTLIVPITISNDVVACCCLSRLCLVPTLALCSQLGLLIV